MNLSWLKPKKQDVVVLIGWGIGYSSGWIGAHQGTWTLVAVAVGGALFGICMSEAFYQASRRDR